MDGTLRHAEHVSNPDRQRAWDVLRGFARPMPARAYCELCSEPLADVHEHLVEPAAGKLHCVCTACAVLFGHQEGAKFRRVPRRCRLLADFQMDDMQWSALGVPIGLAFFVARSANTLLAIYPSAAGPAHAEPAIEAWDELVGANPILETMEPDVEALLVRRLGVTPGYYLAPLDQCYTLVAIVRMHWKGLSGGEELWSAVQQFFAELELSATVVSSKAPKLPHAKAPPATVRKEERGGPDGC